MDVFKLLINLQILWPILKNMKFFFVRRDIIKTLPKRKMFLVHTAWTIFTMAKTSGLGSFNKLA